MTRFALKLQARGRRDVVEAPGFSGHVVGSMAGPDVVVIRAAIESEMSSRRRLPRCRVVGHFIRAQDVGSVVNFGIAVELVNIAIFFLLIGADCCGVSVFCEPAWAASWPVCEECAILLR